MEPLPYAEGRWKEDEEDDPLATEPEPESRPPLDPNRPPRPDPEPEPDPEGRAESLGRVRFRFLSDWKNESGIVVAALEDVKKMSE